VADLRLVWEYDKGFFNGFIQVSPSQIFISENGWFFHRLLSDRLVRLRLVAPTVTGYAG
jgi:hypothetical protein